MKTNHLRNKLAPVVGFSLVVLFGPVAYAQIPVSSGILGISAISHPELVDGPARATARRPATPPNNVGAFAVPVASATLNAAIAPARSPAPTNVREPEGRGDCLEPAGGLAGGDTGPCPHPARARDGDGAGGRPRRGQRF